MNKLSSAHCGIYRIKWLFDEPEITDFLAKIGIRVGSIVSVVANHQDSLIIKTETGKYALGSELVQGVTLAW